MQLWTSRYAPQSLKEICGNKAGVDKLLQWLNDWSGSLACGFKKPGKNAMNTYRAVLITGSPGIGKTTSAHLCAKLAGFTPVELNASDARSKKLVEVCGSSVCVGNDAKQRLERHEHQQQVAGRLHCWRQGTRAEYFVTHPQFV